MCGKKRGKLYYNSENGVRNANQTQLHFMPRFIVMGGQFFLRSQLILAAKTVIGMKTTWDATSKMHKSQ